MLDVLVIGGGLAGLAAARRLKRDGLSVRLLEARDRIGGRVHSQVLESGHTIDLGAQFFGEAQKRISALVDEAGLTRVPRHSNGATVHLNAPDAEPLLKRAGGLPLPILGQLDLLQSTWQLEAALKSFRNELDRLDQISASRFLAELMFTSQASASFAGFLQGEMCAPLEEFSAYELLDQAVSVGGLEGEAGSAKWFVAEGMEALAQHLASALSSDLILNSAVNGVEEKADWVQVDACAGTFRGRSLIVAVPPQLYAKLGLAPHLGERRSSVVSRFIRGDVIKTMLIFDRPWWRELGASGTTLSAGSLFNGSLDASPANGRAGILVLFSTASSARRLGQTESEAGRIDLAVRWLEKVAGQPVPNLIAARSIDWSNDPWSLGGYASRRGLGGWSAEPNLFASSDRVHFAGTETANEWRSFMEGALQSAERAADAVTSIQ